MNTDTDKLLQFSKAVEDEVEMQVQQILDEAEASRKQLIEKSNDESLNAYNKIKEEMKKISAKYVKIVSKTELDSKRRILQFREKLSNEVVENVKIKLSDFANSDLYMQYLIDSLKGVLATESENTEIVVLLSNKDIKLANGLKKEFNANVSFEESNDINIGGLSVYFKNKNVLIDKTLDAALLEQKEIFNSDSSLKLN